MIEITRIAPSLAAEILTFYCRDLKTISGEGTYIHTYNLGFSIGAISNGREYNLVEMTWGMALTNIQHLSSDGILLFMAFLPLEKLKSIKMIDYIETENDDVD